MPMSREIGATVPLEEFREVQRAAVLAAGRGRSWFDDAESREVVFSIVDGRTDVMAEGTNKDGADFAYRVVRDMSYSFERRYEKGVTTRMWTSLSLDDTSEGMRFVVRNAEESRRVGTPLALLDGLHGDKATVVSVDGDHTTYAVQLGISTYTNVFGDLGSTDRVLPPVDVHWTVDASDRPVWLGDPKWDAQGGLGFSDWGTAPVVVAPEGEVVDLEEFLMWDFRKVLDSAPD